jgi:hypothetical protein
MLTVRKLLSFALITLLAASPLRATEASKPDASKPDADGFVPLFNGKDLSGWVTMNVHPGTFSVRDGIIVSTGKPTGIMRTERMYENFEIEMEWKHHTPGGNAGLFIWGDGITAPGTPFARGIEVQILDHGYITQHPSIAGKATGHGDVFAIHGATMKPLFPHPAGWARCLPSENRAKGPGEWNHYRVVCNNGVIKLSVNGKEVSGGTECSPRKGYICLESEGAECHFRNIRIKELPGTGATAEQTAKADPGYKLLYNGIDLQGWDAADPGHKGHWTPRDWTLDYDGKSTAQDKSLWSEQEFGDFELIVDWRLGGKPAKPATKDAIADAGESGIVLRGSSKASIAIHCKPTGSGEITGYAADTAQPDDVRKAATPQKRADKPAGSWNRFVITARGEKVTVTLNGQLVVEEARLPGLPAKGRIGLEHRGHPVQFGNVFIRPL